MRERSASDVPPFAAARLHQVCHAIATGVSVGRDSCLHTADAKVSPWTHAGRTTVHRYKLVVERSLFGKSQTTNFNIDAMVERGNHESNCGSMV